MKKRYIRINKMNFIRCFLLLSVFVMFFGCKKTDEIEEKIRNIPIEINLHRFDRDFANTKPENFSILKKEYPAFFPEQYPDEFWIKKMNDTLQIELENETLKNFPEDDEIKDVLEPLFRHIKYYFKNFRTPAVYTVTSEVDYLQKVILADSILIIELDNYLGEDHEFYIGIEKYFVKNMRPSQIGPDVAGAYAKTFVVSPKRNTFLDLIIYYGKKLYLKDLWLPNISDAEKIGYTEEEFQWAEENEIYMWQYFIENETLYSSDPKLQARFLNPAPFSKFYLEIDNESPGMLGRYLGWKIVRSYMKNNKTDVRELIMLDAEELFNKSKYKPKK